MNKIKKMKIPLISFVILVCLFFTSASGTTIDLNTFFTEQNNFNNSVILPFWICKINTTGNGTTIHSGDNIFISINYEEDSNSSTEVSSFFGLINRNFTGEHDIVIFFFYGEKTIPPSGTSGYCHIDGICLMAQIM